MQKAYNGKRCPLDDFELCLYTTGGRTYPLCPNCYNYPPVAIGGVLGAPTAADPATLQNNWIDPEILDAGKEDMRAEPQRSADEEGDNILEPDFDGDAAAAAGIVQNETIGSMISLCQRCPMSELHPAIAPLVVCACPDTAETGGALMLDPTGGPHWKLISTQCSYTIKLPAGAHRVRVLPEVNDYGCRLLEVDFNKNQSPMGPDETKYIGVLGEGLLDLDAGLLTQEYGKGGPRRGGGGDRGRGRGRGGGGRGGGGRGGGRGRGRYM